MATRKLNKLIEKITAGNFQPDTGLSVTIRTDEATPVTVTTATENPASSGNYEAVWTTTPKFGFWYVTAVKKDAWGRLWLGVDGQIRHISIFRKVKVFDSADSPTGAKGSAKIFTSGTTPLNLDEDGFAPITFTKIPIVTILKNYQERMCFVSNDPSLSASNVTFQTSMTDDGADNTATQSYADIGIICMD